jgi:hypothetical protein
MKDVVGTGTRLDDGDAGSGVRDEAVTQTVPVHVAERAHRTGEVDDPPTGGVDVEYIGVH